MATATVHDEATGRPIDLTGEAGRGGEATVYLTPDPAEVVKVFPPKVREAKAVKVEQMMYRPLRADRFAWPLGRVLGASGGRPVGYRMGRVTGIPVFTLYNPAARATAGLPDDSLFRLSAAVALSNLVADAHRGGYKLCDLNESNVLVHTDSGGKPVRPVRLTCIDTDSFEFDGRDPATGAPCVMRSGVGKDPYLPPELLDKDLSTTDRTTAQDAFALATMIWQLLKGDMPFSVRDPSGTQPPPLLRLMKEGQWPYAPRIPLRTGLVPTDAGIPFRSLPGEVQSLFAQTFRDGFAAPDSRPSAAGWRDALSRWEEMERRQLPTPWATLWQSVRGRVSLKSAVSVLDAIAERAPLARAWAWLRTENRLRNAGIGLTLAAFVGFGLAWETASPPAAGHGAGLPEDTPRAASPRRDPAREARVAAEQWEAGLRWEGAPSIFREALKERLEEGP